MKNPKGHTLSKSVPTTEVTHRNLSIHIRVAKSHEFGAVADVQTHRNTKPTQGQLTPRQPLTHRNKNARPPRVQTHRRASTRQPATLRHVAPRRHLSKPLNSEPTNRPPTTTETKTGRRTCTTDHSWRFYGKAPATATPGRQARSAKLIRRFPHKRKLHKYRT